MKPASRSVAKVGIPTEPLTAWVAEIIRLIGAHNSNVNADLDDPGLVTAIRLERKVKATPAKTLAGLLAKLRLAKDQLEISEHGEWPLTAETAYRWRGGGEHEALPLVASMWADAERLIAPAGDDAKLFKLCALRVALLVEAARVSAQEDRVVARIKAKLGTDGWPVFNPSVPELAPIAELAKPWVKKDGTISLWDLTDFHKMLREAFEKLPATRGRDLKALDYNARWRVKWWKREAARIRAAQHAAGLPKITRRWSAIHRRVDRLTDQIMTVPAVTLAGIVAKLRIFFDEARLEGGSADDLNPPTRMAISALSDAERLLALGSK